MAELKNSKQFGLQEAKRIVGLLNNSYADYLSARVLYTSELLIPATILANTALEKYFKAYLEVKGLKITIQHDTLKIFQLIKNERPEIASQINEEYLAQLTKIYKSRYLENISPGYNFVVLKRKYLAELDTAYSILEPLLRFANHRGEIPNSHYQNAIEDVDPRLYNDNHVLNEIPKKDFVETTDLVHEFRILFNHETLESVYYTDISKHDNRFAFVGVFMEDDNQTVQLSHVAVS